MKKLLMMVVIIGLAVFMASHAFCEEKEPARDCGYGYHMMGPGYGMGSGHMMGQGYGMGGYNNMMGEDTQARGMYRRGRAYKPRALQSMKPEQREKWQKMRAAHMMNTMDLRMKLAAKRVELKTLWAQPEIDKDRINKLSDEVAMLQAELLKKRNQHLLQCRQKFGDKGWDCPGGW